MKIISNLKKYFMCIFLIISCKFELKKPKSTMFFHKNLESQTTYCPNHQLSSIFTSFLPLLLYDVSVILLLSSDMNVSIFSFV